MREVFSLRFDKSCDRFFHFIWLRCRSTSVRMLEPVPPRFLWATAFHELKSSLKIEMNEDGTVATLRLRDVMRDVVVFHRAHELMLLPGATVVQ
eukprot:1197847-Pleurochrysis_carterae.AAC.2